MTPDSSEVSGVPKHSLSHSPLERVLCQLRWRPLSIFDKEAVASKFAQLIGGEYPYHERANELQVVITPMGVQQQAGEVVHRYLSGERDWAVSLGDQFLAVETTSYVGHEDFFAKTAGLAAALRSVVAIPRLARLGYRYTNRIKGSDDLAALDEYFNQEILGLVCGTRRLDIQQSVSETLLNGESAALMVRSVLLPAGAGVAPDLQPIDETSWVLDLDSFEDATEAGIPFDQVSVELSKLHDQASSLFWSLTKEGFVERYK
jgi:uncharacterized protein (TIGR04255 family)